MTNSMMSVVSHYYVNNKSKGNKLITRANRRQAQRREKRRRRLKKIKAPHFCNPAAGTRINIVTRRGATFLISPSPDPGSDIAGKS